MITVAEVFQKSAEMMRPAIEAYAHMMERLGQEYASVIGKIAEAILPYVAEIAERVKEWQEDQKRSVASMAEQGWFPNWFTFDYYPNDHFDNLDEYMINHLDESWDDIKQKIFDLCPKRKQILEVAFDLHEQGNYIASVPLMLMQSDGICSEEFTYFFTKDGQTGNKASDEILQKVENGELTVNFLSEVLLEPFKIKLQISQGASKYSASAKQKGPNRHGIIHGSRKHLDYGNRINGYKAFSFLAFIVYTTKDAFKERET